MASQALGGTATSARAAATRAPCGTHEFHEVAPRDVEILRCVDGKIAPPFRLLSERPSVWRAGDVVGIDDRPVDADGRRAGQAFALRVVDGRVERSSRVLIHAQISTSPNGSARIFN
jgi:hypothetical protein